MSEKQHTPEEWEKSWEEINGHIPNGVNPHAYKWGFIAGHKYGLSQAPDLLEQTEADKIHIQELKDIEIHLQKEKADLLAKVEELQKELDSEIAANLMLKNAEEENQELKAKVEEQGNEIERLNKRASDHALELLQDLYSENVKQVSEQQREIDRLKALMDVEHCPSLEQCCKEAKRVEQLEEALREVSTWRTFILYAPEHFQNKVKALLHDK